MKLDLPIMRPRVRLLRELMGDSHLLRLVLFLWVSFVCVTFSQTELNAREIQDCLGDPVSATGKPSPIGELARANAFFTWKEIVKETHGTDYMEWVDAAERKLVCNELTSGENKGMWECTRIGRPCRAPVNLRVLKIECQQTVLSAWGAPKRTEEDAKRQAIKGWEILAKRKLGAEWALWDSAKMKSVGCQPRGAKRLQCLAEGYACAAPKVETQ